MNADYCGTAVECSACNAMHAQLLPLLLLLGLGDGLKGGGERGSTGQTCNNITMIVVVYSMNSP